MTYAIKGFSCFTEEDIFNDGCQPNSGTHWDESTFHLTSDTIRGLLDKVKKYFDVEEDALELDACEELGRLDVSRMEDKDGCNASAGELDSWKAGNTRLWLADYIMHVVKQESLSIAETLAQEAQA